MVFFGVSLTYYARTAIVVDGGGVTYRGMVRTDYFAFRDILKVDILPGPVTVYAVRGRGRGTLLLRTHVIMITEPYRLVKRLRPERHAAPEAAPPPAVPDGAVPAGAGPAPAPAGNDHDGPSMSFLGGADY